MPQLRVQPCHGKAIEPYLMDLAQLRIEVFREFPYLYDGDLDYEHRYLQRYADSPQSLVVIAFDGSRVVGVSTGMPLEHEIDAFRKPFEQHKYNPAEIFYFGESVLRKSYRGRGIGVTFFQAREAYARDLGRFRYTAFCAVDRPEDHPRRPEHYTPLDRFWQKRGYARHPQLHTTFSWKELDEAEESPKKLTFWIKALAS